MNENETSPDPSSGPAGVPDELGALLALRLPYGQLDDWTDDEESVRFTEEIARMVLAAVEPVIAARVRAEDERAHLQTIDERDRAEEWADRLALALGGEAIGEHSSVNNPWARALEIASERDERVRAEERRRIADELDALNDRLLARRDKNREAELMYGTNLARRNVGAQLSMEDAARAVRKLRDEVLAEVPPVPAGSAPVATPTEQLEPDDQPFCPGGATLFDRTVKPCEHGRVEAHYLLSSGGHCLGPEPDDSHSQSCSRETHGHGSACAADCPSCQGSPVPAVQPELEGCEFCQAGDHETCRLDDADDHRLGQRCCCGLPVAAVQPEEQQ